MKNLLISPIVIISLLASCGYEDDASDFQDSSDPYYSDYQEIPTQGEQYNEIIENPFISTLENNQSTFSIDTDGASYANVRRFLMRHNQLPPANAIRTEELINYFPFDYPETDETISLNSEIAKCPWNEQNLLLRIGLKGKSLDIRPPSNFVFLIDVSGSMGTEDKLPLLQTGLKQYIEQLDGDDILSIVTYAGSSGVLAEGRNGTEKTELSMAVDALTSGGSTAGAAGITTAYEIAEKYFIDGGNNRIILGSDGDFNVGISSQSELISLIEEKRATGIYLTVLGLGTRNLNEGMMEQLANNGNGNYEYLDNPQQLQKVFIQEYDKFFTIAKDVKVQLTFDSDQIEEYRLIGYENRLLENQDFDNENTDAGELGASQTVTALYELIPTKDYQVGNTALSIGIKYKNAVNSSSYESSMDVNATMTDFDQSSEHLRFCAAITGYSMLLRDSKFKGSTKWEDVFSWSQNAMTFDPNNWRAEFLEIADQAERLSN
jgi:Ca-activated chloride channel family protein